jgi:hypothetical protein
LVFDRAALESLMRSTERLMHPSSTLRNTSFAALLIALLAMPTLARSQPEVHRVLDLLMMPPKISAAPRFSARLLVPPGQLYDPLFPFMYQGAVWLNDDGGEEDDKGSRILSVSPAGKVSVIVGLGKLLPVTGVDVAPPGFGNYSGQLITLSQPHVAAEGAVLNHVIQVVDPHTGKATIACTLPTSGTVAKGVSGFGVEAKFGPATGPFGERFFAVTAYNDAVYEFTGVGECKPFADFSKYGAPIGLTFTPDGSAMLVSVAASLSASPTPGQGMILSVSPAGAVDAKPYARGFTSPAGMAFAPQGFGQYGGQLFVTDVGDFQIPVPMTQRLKPDGVVYRVTTDGQPHRVATGFINPLGLTFVGDSKLWVTDINGDFIAGKRELPDGFIVEITPH